MAENKHRHLTKEEVDFILKNLDTMSNKEIARELYIPRDIVQKYRENAAFKKATLHFTELVPADKFPVAKIKKALPWVVFTAILLLAIDLRHHTFNLPHYRGDQHHYAGLAFKLATQGINGYNLRGIDVYVSKQFPDLITIAPAKDKGYILKSLEEGGITYYDEPLHHIPFGFPAALLISHSIFAFNSPFHLLAVNERDAMKPVVGLKNFRFNPEIAGKQFYAVIVPLFFSFLMICLVYFMAKILFNDEWIALTAMFLMTISPVDIMTSQKVWADDMTAGLATLGAFLYIVSIRNERPVMSLLGGIFCGFSVITKQNGAIIPFSIVVWHYLSNMDNIFKKGTFLKTIFDKHIILFCFGTVLSSAYWFIKVYSIYGDILYRPSQDNLTEVAKTDWFKMVQNRPKHLYLLGIPYQNPLFGLAYIAPLWLWLKKQEYKNLLFAVVWLASAFFLAYRFFTGEHRYMLPAYPAFAILGAYVANRLRELINARTSSPAGTALLLVILAVSAFWGVPMALDVLFHDGALIMRPF